MWGTLFVSDYVLKFVRVCLTCTTVPKSSPAQRVMLMDVKFTKNAGIKATYREFLNNGLGLKLETVLNQEEYALWQEQMRSTWQSSPGLHHHLVEYAIHTARDLLHEHEESAVRRDALDLLQGWEDAHKDAQVCSRHQRWPRLCVPVDILLGRIANESGRTV